MQAEIPQAISGTAMRWGTFTAPQLGWLLVQWERPYPTCCCGATSGYL